MTKTPKQIIIVAVTAVAAIIGTWIGIYLFRGNNDFDTELMAAASELNKQCPMMVDKDTRLDNAMGGPGKVFTYNYTLINHSLAQLNIPDLQAYLRPRLIANAESSADMKSFRDNSVTLVYRYNDKDNKSAFEVRITPEEYVH